MYNYFHSNNHLEIKLKLVRINLLLYKITHVTYYNMICMQCTPTQYKKNLQKLEEQLDHQKQYYANIISEMKNKISWTEEENRSSFTSFSKIMR